ncbi:putative DNA primase large subunit [Hibiscus syriacus]|uniref:DNA primase large subunit n=1 Tax=Hibiscus syriacus TaxID=106335 RepID=A0A6A3BL85_HIBSY|nr:putative DNA primase large subunit [Hibiscus syriacus]
MEVVQSHRKFSSNNVNVSTLPLYRYAPPLEVRLEDFELFAMGRLRGFALISIVHWFVTDETLKNRDPEYQFLKVSQMDWAVERNLKKWKNCGSWKANMRHPQANEEANKDVISHFVLRLVYCRTEELRKWFFPWRLHSFATVFALKALRHRALMSEFKLPYKAVSNAEFESVKDKLGQVARSMGQTLAAVDAIFYKVPFEEVPELVAGRRVFIYKGHAYVAMNQSHNSKLSIKGTHFNKQHRVCLSKAYINAQRHHAIGYLSKVKEVCITTKLLLLNIISVSVLKFLLCSFEFHGVNQVSICNLACRKWTSTVREQEKDRLAPIVEALCTSYLGADYSQPSEVGEISVKDIDHIAKTSFPLCMRHLFEKVREDHHLKHGGRMQLGLFLKGVGLKLDDALAFWKSEFASKVSPERFDKEYAYNIRHNYGREGKRTVRYHLIRLYTLFLSKIISSTPGVGDHHDSVLGFSYTSLVIPDKIDPGQQHITNSEENLRAALVRMGVSSRAVEDVMDKVRNRHYQLACTLTFEAVHGSSCDTGINHPNQYFIDSQRILQSKVDEWYCGIRRHFQATVGNSESHILHFIRQKSHLLEFIVPSPKMQNMALC